MIIRTGGCERGEAEYPAPYKAAGSKLTAVIETIFVGEEGVSPVPARRLTSASPPRPHMRDHLPHAVRGFLEKDLHIAVTDVTQLSGGPKVLVIGTMGWGALAVVIYAQPAWEPLNMLIPFSARRAAPRCKTQSLGTVCTPRSPSVLQALHWRAPSSDARGCNTASYEFIFLVRNEEAEGSNPGRAGPRNVTVSLLSLGKRKRCGAPSGTNHQIIPGGLSIPRARPFG